MPSPGVRVAVAESLIRDLGRVSESFDLRGMKLNASKTNTRFTHNESPATPLTIGRTVPKESDDLVIFGVTFDSKISFEKSYLGFQNSFSKIYYLEELLASVPW